MCVSIVFKAETKEKYDEKKFSEGFCFKTQKHPILGVKQFFKNNFVFCFIF